MTREIEVRQTSAEAIFKREHNSRIYTVEFAKEINDIVRQLPVDLEVGSLILWNDKKYDTAFKAAIRMGQIKSTEQEILENLQETPQVWTDFMKKLSIGQNSHLSLALRRMSYKIANNYSERFKVTLGQLADVNKEFDINTTKTDAFIALAFRRD